MKRTTLLGPCIALSLSAALAGAQGSDDCANAQPIAGLGLFPFDNTTATIDGPFDCNGQPVRRDVWFDWLATSTGDFRLETCGQTSLVTRIGVYAGLTCPPTALLTCVQGGCLDQTILGFAAVSGQHYLLRVGSRYVGPGGTGNFRIETDPCPSAPDDGFEENDTCQTAVAIGNGSFPGLFVRKTDPDWWAMDVNDGDTLTINVFFTHSTGDIDIYLIGPCGGPDLVVGGSGTDNEIINYTNNTGACQRVKLRVEHWVPDTASDCQNYSMTISGAGDCGPPCTSFCSANVNATGMAASLSCSGDPLSSLTLTSTPVPETTGQFFYGPMNLIGSPFGDGLLCVGGALTRMLPFVTAGMMAQLPNTATLILNYTAPYAAGLTGTKHFQHWFRSGLATGAGFNTSNAVTVTF